LRVVEVTAPTGNASERSLRSRIYVQGTLHGREWIVPTSLMYLVDALVSSLKSNDGEVIQLLQHYVVCVLPVANPDGYAYSMTTNRLWRKNR
jgi:extracellular matrix protein 14